MELNEQQRMKLRELKKELEGKKKDAEKSMKEMEQMSMRDTGRFSGMGMIMGHSAFFPQITTYTTLIRIIEIQLEEYEVTPQS